MTLQRNIALYLKNKITFLMKKNPPHINEQKGFSLITVLVGVGILSVVLLAYAISVNHEMNARKSIASKKQVNDVLSSVSNEVIEQFNTQLSSISSTSNYATVFNSVAIGATAKMQYATRIAPPGNVPSTLLEMKKRCAYPQVTANFYHFCLLLSTPDTKAPAGSFENSNFAVMELAIKLIDLQTRSLQTTATYNGLEVYYYLYWSYNDKIGTDKIGYHNKKGFFYASKTRTN